MQIMEEEKRQKMNKEERRDLWIKEMKVGRKETETIIIE